MISQLILEDVTGMKYEVFMQDSILRPLGMLNSTFSQIIDLSAKYAAGYDSLGNRIPGKYPVLPEQAAAGLWTTPTDLCRFIIDLQLTLAGQGGKIISKRTAELMMTPYLDKITGAGVFVNHFGNHLYFSHEAANRGFSGAYYASAEDGKAVVVFMNAEHNNLTHEIRDQVMEVYNWKGISRKMHKTILTVDDKKLERVIGLYIGGNSDGKTDTLRIKKEKGKYFYLNKDKTREMFFTSETEFINLDFPSEKTFVLGKNGNVEALIIKANGQERKFRKL